MEIRRIRQAEAVTDLWDESCGGVLKERGRRNIAAMLVLAASSHRAACFVDDDLNGFVLAELAEDGLLPCRFGRVEELYARGESADVVESLGFQAETTRFGLYRESSTSNWTSSP